MAQRRNGGGTIPDLDVVAGRPIHVWTNPGNAVEAFALSELLLGLKSLGVRPVTHRGGLWLRKYSAALCMLPRAAARPKLGLALQGIPAQGYRVEAVSAGALIAGGDPNGFLYGVYAFLEALGVRFPAPGGDGLRVLRNAQTKRLRLPLVGRPRFENRAVMFVGGFAGASAEDCLTFLARCRVNKIVHMNVQNDTLRFRRQANRRGIACEVGAHEIDRLLPREEFARHPEYFRLPPGGLTVPRTLDHNACSSGVGTRKLIERNAARFARLHAGAVGFHWWPDDIENGGWCYCPTCKHLSASEQSLQCSNAAARGVQALDPRIQVCFLGYHDTCEAPRRVKPLSNVFLLYAPRDRCYAHGLGDPRCERNVTRSAAFEKQLEVFGKNPFTGPFDYYVDGLLFRNFIPPMLNVMSADFKYYERLGLRQLTSHFGSTREVSAVELLNAIAFGRMGYDKRLTPGQVVREYAHAVFQGRSSVLENVLILWEEILRPALSLCRYDVGEEAADYLWPLGACGPAARAYERQLIRSCRQFKRLSEALGRVSAKGLSPFGKARLNELKEVLALVAAEMEIWICQVLGQNRRMAYLRRNDRVALREATKAFMSGARKARAAIRRFCPVSRPARNGYRGSQTVMANEMEYLSRWCSEETDT